MLQHVHRYDGQIARNPKENILHDFAGKILAGYVRKVILLNYQNIIM